MEEKEGEESDDDSEEEEDDEEAETKGPKVTKPVQIQKR